MGVKVRKPRGYTAWCVVIDHKGQRKTIAVRSREAAERVRREIEIRLAVGGRELLDGQPPAPPTLAEYSKEWLAHVGHERKPSSAGRVVSEVCPPRYRLEPDFPPLHSSHAVTRLSRSSGPPSLTDTLWST